MLNFYTRVVNSVGLIVKDNELFISKNNAEIPLTRDHGLRVALPDIDKIKNELYVQVDGEFVPTLKLFNPLKENALQDGLGLNILREHAIDKLNLSFAGYGYLLLLLIGEPKLQDDLPMEINNFLTTVRDKNIKGMKKSSVSIVDETMLKTWKKLITEAIKDPDNVLFNIVVRNPEIMGKEVTRESLLSSELYDKLKEYTTIDDNIKVMDITLRPKDINVFCSIFKTIFKEDNHLVFQTTDKEAPGFIVLMKLYLEIMNSLNATIELLEPLDPDTASNSYTELLITQAEIDNSPVTYRKDILLIPSENEINKGSTSKSSNELINTAKSTEPSKPLDYQNKDFDPVDNLVSQTVQQQHAMMSNSFTQNTFNNGFGFGFGQQNNNVLANSLGIQATNTAFTTAIQPQVSYNPGVTFGYNLLNNSYYI